MAEKCYFGPMDNVDDSEVKRLLSETVTIALVGASDMPSKPSNDIMSYLLSNGYDVIPVNPNHEQVLGRECYPSLLDLDKCVDMVNVFRNPRFLMPIMEEAIKIRPKCVWLQMGVVNSEAYRLSIEAGILTIMNRCIKTEHKRLML
ncbi:MAG: CoA-binding protein [Candidatus Methanofastidiosa archaeon]|nr:CoA-binding protein [Candidatus Methanofastidiosa archaeon]